MRVLKYGLLVLCLLWPSFVLAAGVLTPAASPSNPQTSTVSASGIPFIKASSGTMGNNGAISAMTALPKTYTAGAYILLPAGAVAAGVPAAITWYWFVGSSTTAGTVYNNIYTSGTPVAPLTPTAFVTTGPGAYTGDTTARTAVTIPLAGSQMGLNGRLEGTTLFIYNNTGGNKVLTVKYGGTTAIFTQTVTTALNTLVKSWVSNRGVANAQATGYVNYVGSALGLTVNATDGAINTAAPFSWFVELSTAVATDHAILDHYSLELVKDVNQ